MRSQLNHVNELTSKIEGKTISFEMVINGKSVNTSKFQIQDLQGPEKIVNLDIRDATHWILSNHNLKVGVLVDGQLKMSLDPSVFITHARITFDSVVDAGKTFLVVTGLKTKKDDKYLRIRCRKQKRREVYEKMENDPELVTFIGECVLEENELGERSDNNTSGVVAAPAVGLPSRGRTNHKIAALSLAYEEPSFVTGIGEVALIPATAININVVDTMEHAQGRPLLMARRTMSPF